MNPEQQLSDALGSRGKAYDPAPIGFEEVTRRAGRIRRRRLTASIAATGLGLVGVVGIATTWNAPTGGQQIPPVATGSVHPTPFIDTVGPLSLSSVKRGAAPHVAYLFDGRVYSPGDIDEPLPNPRGVTSFGSYHGGWVTVRNNELVTQFDADGAVVRSGPGSGLSTDADGARHGFAINGTLYVGSPMAEGETAIALRSGSVFKGFVSGSRWIEERDGKTFLVSSDGNKHTRLPMLTPVRATSPTGDLYAGSGDDALRVSSIDGTTTWETTAWIPESFSPDGTLVAALSPSEGLAKVARVAILDAKTGQRLAYFRLTEHSLELAGMPRWEDNSHLLFGAKQLGNSQVALLRLGVDKSLVRATKVLDATHRQGFVISD